MPLKIDIFQPAIEFQISTKDCYWKKLFSFELLRDEPCRALFAQMTRAKPVRNVASGSAIIMKNIIRVIHSYLKHWSGNWDSGKKSLKTPNCWVLKKIFLHWKYLRIYCGKCCLRKFNGSDSFPLIKIKTYPSPELYLFGPFDSS